MSDLYADLGLDPSADDETIRKAHRRKSMAHHPDTGDGNDEAFRRVQHAALILRDPERRKKYDETGEDGAEPDNTQAEIAAMLSACFEQAYSDARDVDRVNLVKKMENVFKVMDASICANRDATELAISKADKALSRLTFKGEGNDFLSTMLRSKLKEGRDKLALIEKTFSNLQEAKKLFEGYSYEAEGDFRNITPTDTPWTSPFLHNTYS